MTTHRLKTWPGPFQAVYDDLKTYEVRKNDRNYQVGDELVLIEWDPDTQTKSGRAIWAIVKYMTKGGSFGLPEELCVLSIRVVGRSG